jgi:hypothetical protein
LPSGSGRDRGYSRKNCKRYGQCYAIQKIPHISLFR